MKVPPLEVSSRDEGVEGFKDVAEPWLLNRISCPLLTVARVACLENVYMLVSGSCPKKGKASSV
jgi:hypothetical protein